MKTRVLLLAAVLLAIVSAAVANIAPPLLPAIHATDVGKVLGVGSNLLSTWLPAGGGAVLGPTASTTNDLAAFGGTGGNKLVDSGIPEANVVLVSRTISAGTGLTVTNSGLLTSDITMSMSTVDNQALTVGGLLTAASGLQFTGPSDGNAVTVPTGEKVALRFKDASGATGAYFATVRQDGGPVAVSPAMSFPNNYTIYGHGISFNDSGDNSTTWMTIGSGAYVVISNLHTTGGILWDGSSFQANAANPSFTFANGGGTTNVAFNDNITGNDWIELQRDNNAIDSVRFPVGIFGSTGVVIASGNLGEERRCTVTAASGLTMSSGVTLNICSITLTPGVWQVTAICGLDSSLTGTDFQCGISTTSATMPGASLKGDSWVETPTVSSATADDMITVPSYRVLVTAASGNTLYYMTEQATVSAGTPKGYGRMNAERR